MLRIVGSIFCAALMVAGSSADAQQAPSIAPVPEPERAFIANVGGDFGVDLSVVNVVEGGVASRAYNEFFAGMKSWGRYEIVANPARADWLFDISVSNHQTCIEYRVRDSDQGSDTGRTEVRPENHFLIELTMMDVKTLGLRKRFIEPVKPAGLFRDPDKIFDQAIAALVDDVKEEIGEHGSKTSVADVTGPLGPIPPKIGSAQRVFIRNLGAGDASGDKYSSGAGNIYNLLATDLKSWGRYEVVATRGQADLVFEIDFFVQPECRGLGFPQFRLAIVDANSDTLLWGFTTHVNAARLIGNARKNFIQGMAELVATTRELAERPTWENNAKTTAVAPPATTWITTPTGTGPPIPVAISLARNVVKSGAEVRVKVTLSNASKQELKFTYATDDPITCAVVVNDAKGDPVPDTAAGKRVKNAHAAWHAQPATYSLDPGETQTRECDVSDLYDMTAPGKYSIEVQQLDGRAVRSNAVTVTVVR